MVGDWEPRQDHDLIYGVGEVPRPALPGSAKRIIQREYTNFVTRHANDNNGIDPKAGPEAEHPHFERESRLPI
jgi:hypothetical protein